MIFNWSSNSQSNLFGCLCLLLAAFVMNNSHPSRISRKHLACKHDFYCWAPIKAVNKAIYKTDCIKSLLWLNILSKPRNLCFKSVCMSFFFSSIYATGRLLKLCGGGGSSVVWVCVCLFCFVVCFVAGCVFGGVVCVFGLVFVWLVCLFVLKNT